MKVIQVLLDMVKRQVEKYFMVIPHRNNAIHVEVSLSVKAALFKAGLWIRIRIGSGFSDFVDPDSQYGSGSGSRGKKIKKFQWKNAL
jgi:hypothetical protein